jgi:hypothetical protein
METLQFYHILRFQSFRPIDRIKTDAIVLCERLEAATAYGLMMHEHVWSVILSYESITLLVVKPFHSSFWQFFSPPLIGIVSAPAKKKGPQESFQTPTDQIELLY